MGADMRTLTSALGPIWEMIWHERADMRILISALGPIWHERADMGADMRTLISARGPIWDFSYLPSQPISALSTHICPHISPLQPYQPSYCAQKHQNCGIKQKEHCAHG